MSKNTNNQANNAPKNTTKEQCAAEYKRLTTKNGSPIGKNLWDAHSQISSRQIKNLYGTWGRFKIEMDGESPKNAKIATPSLEFDKDFIIDEPNDSYIFLLEKKIGKNIALPKSTVKQLITLYSNFAGEELSLAEISLKFGIPKQYLTLIFNILDITHESLPLLDEDVLDKDENESVEEVLQGKKTAIYNKLQNKSEEEKNKAAAKWYEYESNRNKELDFVSKLFNDKVKENRPEPKGIQSGREIKKNNDNLMLLAIPDFHLGKLSWAAEVGQDYDINLACDLFKKAAYDLVNRNYPPVDKILFVLGNDFFNCDTVLNTTTQGTAQDEDTRWQKTFNKGCDLLIEVIDTISQVAPVDIMLIPGNHSLQREYYLTQFLRAWYRNNKQVKVDGGPKVRKYYKWGQVLLGFDHGNEVKNSDLPLIMAAEVPDMWGSSKYKEILLGHYHTEKTKEINGVKVKILPSLSATDAWHNKKGYIGNIRAAEALIYNKESGLQTVHYYNAK